MGRKTTFKIRRGAKVRKELAPLIVTECEALHAVGLPVIAPNLLERASDPENPLHGEFQWDDVAAGGEWRLHQARRLIGCVIEFDVKTKRYGRALYNVDISEGGEPEQAYMRRQKVIRNAHWSDQLSARLYSEIVTRVDEIESLGLQDKDPAWRRLASSVRKNVPKAAK